MIEFSLFKKSQYSKFLVEQNMYILFTYAVLENVPENCDEVSKKQNISRSFFRQFCALKTSDKLSVNIDQVYNRIYIQP